MKKRTTLLCFIAVLLLCLGSKHVKSQRVSIIITGNLGNLFHSIESEQIRRNNIAQLNTVLEQIFKLYPESIVVDTGNFFNWLDVTERCEKSPAIAHFRTHRYDVINFGVRDLFLSKSLTLWECPFPDNKSTYLSLALLSDNGQRLGRPFVDIPTADLKSNLRIIGATHFDSKYSAPSLMSFFRIEDIEAAIISYFYLDNKENSFNILLSNLSPAENDFLAQKYSSINIIIESHSSSQEPIRKINQTYIVHKTGEDFVGRLSFDIKDAASIDKIKYQSFPVQKKSKGFFSFLRKKDTTQMKKTIARIGVIIPDERALNMIKVPHDSFEVRRLDGGKYADELYSTRIHYYALYKDHKHAANTFFVDRSEGTYYPPYLYLVTVSPNHELLSIDFIAPLTLVEGVADVDGFLKPYIGKRFEELHFDHTGCSGVEEEFLALHNHIRLVLKLSEDCLR